ncbi:hypothetical protein [Clostridium frigidicarnis]|uniref:Uncharacterized protein n=1 Tax=Clostridium frigidicarnis TaxID=84698 RepID=A0A1I0V283_9CLOT|nr:hypothetical protein [Clostridium frigidicarnis]SFA70428.1 hypothetical protein SAMN04488528_1001107 [Clostridium frigidicarnis]
MEKALLICISGHAKGNTAYRIGIKELQVKMTPKYDDSNLYLGSDLTGNLILSNEQYNEIKGNPRCIYGQIVFKKDNELTLINRVKFKEEDIKLCELGYKVNFTYGDFKCMEIR